MNVNCEVHHHHPTFIWDDIWNEIDAATSSFDSCRSGSDAPTRSLLIRNFWVVVPNIEPWLDIERSLRKFWLSVAASRFWLLSVLEEKKLNPLEEKSVWHPIKAAKFASLCSTRKKAIQGQNMMRIEEGVRMLLSLEQRLRDSTDKPCVLYAKPLFEFLRQKYFKTR